ncbi:MAG: phospho-sugar mutase [Candidatus Saccharimonadales bacterium]
MAVSIETMTEITSHVSEQAAANIQQWLQEPKYAEYRPEVVAMIESGKWRELEDAFFKVAEFGTAGIRGVTGVGSNRINRVTIGCATQALCQYMAEHDPALQQRGIVIAYDTRLTSVELSRYAASVVAANGFTAYLFDGFRSTPELSFAVRYMGCAAGIVLTASHNPPSDNGFKAYWSDGCQLIAPHDKGVVEKAAAVTEIQSIDFDEAVRQGRIVMVGEDVDTAYVQTVVGTSVTDERDVAVAYSSLHGAGQTNTLPILRKAGFTQVYAVDAQLVPDGHFPTIPSGKPNPQDPPANDMAVALMHDKHADIAITNDPDADRFGVMVRQGSETIYLSGNQAAMLATDYVLGALQQRGELTPDHYVVKTIVTTDMMDALAAYYGVECVSNLLVGFKYVGQTIREREGTTKQFVIGAEESFGFIKGEYARDKDGASGALMIAEYAAQLKRTGRTLHDRLLELYVQHGYHLEHLIDVAYPGADGFERMQSIMKGLRAQPPTEVGGHEVTAVTDYQTLERTDTKSGEKTQVDGTAGNVVVLELDGDRRRRLTVRPSGTEPKIKVYGMWYEAADVNADALDHYNQLTASLRQLVTSFETMITM